MTEDGIISGISKNQYENSPIKNFDIYEVMKAIGESASNIGIKGIQWNILKEDGVYKVKASSNRGELTLERCFYYNSDNRLEVHHELFCLERKFQGKGLSKDVLSVFYKQYKKMGVDIISVTANIDVGGYCWAKYGFFAKSKNEIIDAVCFTADDLTYSKEASEFVHNWYKIMEPNLRLHSLCTYSQSSLGEKHRF